MKLFIFFTLIFSVLSIEPVWAACGPPMCPYDPAPTDPPHAPPTQPLDPHRPQLFIGYFEVASPNCTTEDFENAINGSKAHALHLAQVELKTPDVIQVSDYRFSAECKQSIYAGSFQGNSWIVQTFVKYRK